MGHEPIDTNVPARNPSAGPRAAKQGKRSRSLASCAVAGTRVPVVAIGASAGGLGPIGRFLAAMPADSGLAFVVIQHLDPSAESLLPTLLAKNTTMKVQSASDGVMAMPNHVYVIPPGVHLSIAGGRLRLVAVPAGMGARTPFDVFLRSLAADSGRLGIGIVLSGTGTDGGQGLKALREAGGLNPGPGSERSTARRHAATRHTDNATRLRPAGAGDAKRAVALCRP